MKTTNTYNFVTINGTHFTANKTMTHCYCWPEGRLGERVRIKKAEFEAAQRENEMEKAIAEAEESTTTEEIEQKDKELAPKKAKKTRKSKDVAFSYCPNGTDVITLTAKQVDFIHHLPDTCFWEHGVDSVIWVDCLCDEIGGQFQNKPMTVGAMISTLCEKSLGNRGTDRRNGKKCTMFELTPMGKQVAIELGLQ